MPARIRLARHGRKRHAYYHIVVADSRAPRDGRFIERIGTYNPNTNPATIDLDFDKALSWLQNGAQPSDTVNAILSYKGVLYKKHLLGGVKKGAFDEEEAEKRFEAWLAEKEAKIQAKKDRIASDVDKANQKQFEAETKIKEERAAVIAAKNAELAAEVEETAEGAVAEEEAPAAVEPPVVEEAPAAEEVKVEEAKSEEPAKEETAKAAPAEEKAEPKAETPAKEEEKAEKEPETPAKEEEKAEKKPETPAEGKDSKE